MVDTNILLDVMTEDSTWFDWSSRTMAACAQTGMLVINPIIYAELSAGFDRIKDLDAALPRDMMECRPIPLAAAFLAGKCFVAYKKQGGTKNSTLPDFFIGAHASVAGLDLITRDTRRYATYFPMLKLISPASHDPEEH